jgi:hypothetical protein
MLSVRHIRDSDYVPSVEDAQGLRRLIADLLPTLSTVNFEDMGSGGCGSDAGSATANSNDKAVTSSSRGSSTGGSRGGEGSIKDSDLSSSAAAAGTTSDQPRTDIVLPLAAAAIQAVCATLHLLLKFPAAAAAQPGVAADLYLLEQEAQGALVLTMYLLHCKLLDSGGSWLEPTLDKHFLVLSEVVGSMSSVSERISARLGEGIRSCKQLSGTSAMTMQLR